MCFEEISLKGFSFHEMIIKLMQSNAKKRGQKRTQYDLTKQKLCLILYHHKI